jgi:hypothetical protein
MSVRSSFRVSTLVLLAGVAIGGCAPGVEKAYAGPGWYLEMPRQGRLAYPTYIAGPFSYEECEIARLKAPRPDRLLCDQWKTNPWET